MTRRSGHDRRDIRLKIKGDFFHFNCIRNEGVARESRRGRSDLGPKLNEMPSGHLFSSNVVLNA